LASSSAAAWTLRHSLRSGSTIGRQHQAFDVGARRVVRPERVPLARRQRAFEERAENRRFDLRPVGVCGFDQQADLVAVERDHLGLLEQFAVEARQRRAQDDRETTAVHVAPERGEQRHELLRALLQVFQQRQKGASALVLRQQADIFGEHREQAARQKAGDEFGGVAGAFERLGDARQLVGDGARDAGRNARRVERHRLAPDGLQTSEDRFVGELGKPDAVRARVGKRRVGGAGTGEVGVQFDDLADVDDDQERRPALVGRQRAGIAFGLTAGALQGVIEHPAGDTGPDLLGFKHEMGAPVAVDAAERAAAVAVTKSDSPLEDVGVVTRIVARRIGRRHAEHLAQVADEELIIGQLAAVGIAPAGQEGRQREGGQRRWRRGAGGARRSWPQVCHGDAGTLPAALKAPQAQVSTFFTFAAAGARKHLAKSQPYVELHGFFCNLHDYCLLCLRLGDQAAWHRWAIAQPLCAVIDHRPNGHGSWQPPRMMKAMTVPLSPDPSPASGRGEVRNGKARGSRR
jgi:hypothetical protein